jgi:pyridoxamine 5'-phosphate oxidase
MTPSEHELEDHIRRAREEYDSRPFDIEDLAPSWREQFGIWFDEATRAGIHEPNAMVLATAGIDGAPSARAVLMRGLDERGFTFYSNHLSTKGRQLAANPQAAALFPWFGIHRQVAVRGTVALVGDTESDEYWASRPLESRLSAIASPQSEVVASRAALDRMREALVGNPDADVSRPSRWGGYRITPRTVEFWQGREHRFHDRLRYRLAGARWVTERLAP